MKKFLYKILETPQLTKWGVFIQKILLINIIVNIISFTLYYISPVNKIFIQNILLITNIIFLIELILRYIVIGENKEYEGFIGRIKYTFTIYAIIDILSVLPLFITFSGNTLLILRLIRFFKFLRLKKFIKKFISFESFATSGILTQSLILLIFSAIIIFIFSIFYKSFSLSALVFFDPEGIVELNKISLVGIGIIELILGIIIGGTLISIITSYMENIIHKANIGLLPYKDKNHIVIIGTNKKLEYILEEIDIYSYTNETENDVVLVLSENENIENYRANLKKYRYVNIFLVSGSLLNFNTYRRANINYAKKLIILQQKNNWLNSLKIIDFILHTEEFNNKFLYIYLEFNIYDTNLNNILSIVLNKNKYCIIDNNKLLQRILNRSIVNYKYFRLISELLTFRGYEFYILEIKKFLKKISNFNFIDIFLTLDNGVLVGIERNGKIILNPNYNMKIEDSDKLIMILENKYSFKFSGDIDTPNKIIKEIKFDKKINSPKLKENRKILIVGNYNKINIKAISEFLTSKSLKELKIIIKENSNYIEDNLWNKIAKDNFDIILLNLEDKYEYLLTLYLRKKFDKKFISKIVNIITSPFYANLLESKEYENIIISEKIVAEYITQLLFNPKLEKIFNEITTSYGNEFYILSKNEYYYLFLLDYMSLKKILIKNKMIYIGCFFDNEFIFNAKDIKNASEIVVLCEGS